MKNIKIILSAALPALFLMGCTTTTEVPEQQEAKTVTSVNGVEVKSVAYLCKSAESEGDLTANLLRPFLVEYSSGENAMLVDKTGSYPLTRVRTGSGSKFESADQQSMVWTKGEETTITFDGVTYQECKLKNK